MKTTTKTSLAHFAGMFLNKCQIADALSDDSGNKARAEAGGFSRESCVCSPKWRQNRTTLALFARVAAILGELLYAGCLRGKDEAEQGFGVVFALPAPAVVDGCGYVKLYGEAGSGT
jgi:hypothetical protein